MTTILDEQINKLFGYYKVDKMMDCDKVDKMTDCDRVNTMTNCKVDQMTIFDKVDQMTDGDNVYKMTDCDRVNFYLGKDFFDKKNINYNKLKFFEEHQYPEYLYEQYILPLLNLLEKTNNIDKKFNFTWGDIGTTEDKITLCKNRCSGNNNSVILRCLNFHRHWDLYYNKPLDILYEDKLNVIFWRGITTGSPERSWGNRFDLIERWFEKRNFIDIGFSYLCQDISESHYGNMLKVSVVLNIF